MMSNSEKLDFFPLHLVQIVIVQEIKDIVCVHIILFIYLPFISIVTAIRSARYSTTLNSKYLNTKIINSHKRLSQILR